jgi:hypothetical protein
MFAAAREQVPTDVRTSFAIQQVMIWVFTSKMLIVKEALRKGGKFSQDAVIPPRLRWPGKEKPSVMRRNSDSRFLIHLDNSACQNGQKITRQLEAVRILRTPHPPYSPDLSLCDFWLFRFLKESIRGMESSTEVPMGSTMTTIGPNVTVHTLQFVFKEWMRRFIWIIENNGEYDCKIGTALRESWLARDDSEEAQ